MIYVIKKDGTREKFNVEKIINAVNKSANRILYTFTEDEKRKICDFAFTKAESLGRENIDIQDMHNIVEGALEQVNPSVARSYRDYRNYKKDFVHMMDDVYTKSQSIRYIGDKSNANTDSALVATKRSLIFNELNKELYRKFFMNRNELQACRDGYIYIHDQSARLDTMNCCLFDVGNVLKGGFEMGNVWYNEPKTLDTAFDVMGDIILSTAAQQYGGFTVPEVDKILAPYAEKSYEKYKVEFKQFADPAWPGLDEKAEHYALSKVRRDFDQGWQGIEYKLNTVGVMSSLRRIKQGIFNINDCNTLEQLKNNDYKILSIEEILKNEYIVEVNDFLENMIENGRVLENRYNQDKITFKNKEGKVIAIYKQDANDSTKIRMFKKFN